MKDCKHVNWSVLGINQVGQGTCDDCRKVVNLDKLFNGLRNRMIGELNSISDLREVYQVHLDRYHSADLGKTDG